MVSAVLPTLPRGTTNVKGRACCFLERALVTYTEQNLRKQPNVLEPISVYTRTVVTANTKPNERIQEQTQAA